MDAAVTLRMTAVRTEPPGRAFPRPRISSRGRSGRACRGRSDRRSVLWARCWDVDPDLAGAPAVVVPRLVRRGPAPEGSGGPPAPSANSTRTASSRSTRSSDSRVVDAVWTRYRQECNFGRRTRPGEVIPDRPAPERPGPDAEQHSHASRPPWAAWPSWTEAGLASSTGTAAARTTWPGNGGSASQAVSKRKQKILQEMRHQLEMP